MATSRHLKATLLATLVMAAVALIAVGMSTAIFTSSATVGSARGGTDHV